MPSVNKEVQRFWDSVLCACLGDWRTSLGGAALHALCRSQQRLRTHQNGLLRTWDADAPGLGRCIYIDAQMKGTDVDMKALKGQMACCMRGTAKCGQDSMEDSGV